ncbi:MAG: carboxypeptidase regulatory-like domain-containing protein [Planctomycetales bacterium]|nr:carboxypeptidase regulatory-like domain-containing protein [Planctomycetales bacterium]
MGVRSTASVCLLMAAIIPTLGCGEPDNRKKTYPVSGIVTVDGAPAENLAVRAHPVDGIDKADPTVTSAFTGADGKFTLSTYEKADGIPEGKYKLTFVWGEMNMMTMAYGGPDKLKNRYDKEESSEFEFQVGDDQPTDLGTFDLKTK